MVFTISTYEFLRHKHLVYSKKRKVKKSKYIGHKKIKCRKNFWSFTQNPFLLLSLILWFPFGELLSLPLTQWCELLVQLLMKSPSPNLILGIFNAIPPEALSTYHSTIHKKNSTQVAKHIRLSIICWGYQNSYMKPRDPQFKNLSPLTPIHRHPKCPCPKQNSLFICKIPSVLSLPTSAESIPIYLAVQSRNHKNLNSCFSSTWQC